MTKVMERKFAATQRKMERSMLGFRWDDQKTNEWIREQTSVEDIIESSGEKMEVGRSRGKDERQEMDSRGNRMETNGRKKRRRKTKEKMAR